MKCPSCLAENQSGSLKCEYCGSMISAPGSVTSAPSFQPGSQKIEFYENAVLTRMARESLKGRWGLAVGTFFVFFLISVGIQMVPFIGTIASILISGPMALGAVIFSLSLSRKQDAKLEMIFNGFENFGNALGAYILMVIFIILWMLLLIIPGIIAAFSYAMTFYIIADDSSIGVMDAIDKSKRMMKGYKWKLCCLYFRFIGWYLLSILTLGIGLLWVIPYQYVSLAEFYDDVKLRLLAKEVI